MEAFLHVTMVAIADWNLTSRDDIPHKMKRDKLLHSVGTHPVEEHIRDACSDDATRCAEQHELRNLELCRSTRDMQVADSVSRPGHAPTADFFPLELRHQGALGDSLCHLHTLLGVHNAICFLSAVIWSPWLTRFRYCDRSPKHDKASPSIAILNLNENQIGDDGARALADAVKAILVRWL